MRLLNAHTRVDLQEFLNRSGYFPVEIDEKGKKVRRRRWEMRHITRPVIQIWRIYSSLLRAAMKQPTDLVKRDTFRTVLLVDERGIPFMHVEADDGMAVLWLVAQVDGIDVRRCLACRSFFAMPSGHGHALNYCPGRIRPDGSYRPSACRERQKKRRAKRRQRDACVAVARVGWQRWNRLSKKEQAAEASISDYIAKHAQKISGGKFPYSKKWVTENLSEIRRRAK
jgi:hypothetical protein